MDGQRATPTDRPTARRGGGTACTGSNFLMTRITSDGKRHITCGKWESVALEEVILHVGRDVPNC